MPMVVKINAEVVHFECRNQIVFGDGKNDYSLFKKSKISIAMQKSDKILKEVA
ncbi:MAG: hypothetical protein EOM50_17420, partial [Erysipelotrichia bacterium]|nr:hypothetical protein [Erysipelotrichia bacterium]